MEVIRIFAFAGNQFRLSTRSLWDLHRWESTHISKSLNITPMTPPMIVDQTLSLFDDSHLFLDDDNGLYDALCSPGPVSPSIFGLPLLPITYEFPVSDTNAENHANRKRTSVSESPFPPETTSYAQEACEPTRKRRKRYKDSAASNKSQPYLYQAKQWKERFEELMDFRKSSGHCPVPQSFPSDPPLAGWVKRQRYQCKLLSKGKQSSMTKNRIRALEEVGFVWELAWEDRV